MGVDNWSGWRRVPWLQLCCWKSGGHCSCNAGRPVSYHSWHFFSFLCFLCLNSFGGHEAEVEDYYYYYYYQNIVSFKFEGVSPAVGLFFFVLILVFVARYMGPEGLWQPLSGCHYPILPKVLHMHSVVPLYEAVQRVVTQKRRSFSA